MLLDPLPPVASPNPCPRAPVSTRVLPSRGGSGTDGVVRACSALAGRGGAALGDGSVATDCDGGGAGGRAAGFAGSGGVGVSGTARPAIGVSPPDRGPGAPPKLIIMTTGDVSTAERVGVSQIAATIARWPATLQARVGISVPCPWARAAMT